MQKHKLDSDIDNAIAARLPSPLSRAYLALNRWLDRHLGILLLALFIGAFVALALAFVNHTTTPTK